MYSLRKECAACQRDTGGFEKSFRSSVCDEKKRRKCVEMMSETQDYEKEKEVRPSVIRF